MIPGCYDPKERASDLLSQGVLASVALPDPAALRRHAVHQLQGQGARRRRASRRGTTSSSTSGARPDRPGMFVPMVICQVWDPALAAAEIRRCVDKGAKALCFVENPVADGLPSFHDTDGTGIRSGRRVRGGRPAGVHAHRIERVHADDRSRARRSRPLISARQRGRASLAMINMLIRPSRERFPDIKLVLVGGAASAGSRRCSSAPTARSSATDWAARLETQAVGDLPPQHVGLHDRGADRALAVTTDRRRPHPRRDRLPARRHAVPAHARRPTPRCSPGSRTTSSRRSATATPSAVRLEDGRSRAGHHRRRMVAAAGLDPPPAGGVGRRGRHRHRKRLPEDDHQGQSDRAVRPAGRRRRPMRGGPPELRRPGPQPAADGVRGSFPAPDDARRRHAGVADGGPVRAPSRGRGQTRRAWANRSAARVPTCS